MTGRLRGISRINRDALLYITISSILVGLNISLYFPFLKVSMVVQPYNTTMLLSLRIPWTMPWMIFIRGSHVYGSG